MFGFTALLALGGCITASEQDAVSWYGERDTSAPHANRVVICHGFGCALRTPVSFSAADILQLKALIDAGAASAEAERAALGRAVQWYERRVGPVVGSDKDIGGLDLSGSRVRGQMDCLDEATNTTSLLLVAEANGLLRHHRVGKPVARGFFLDGRYPHATATLIEQGGPAYAIDSWPRDNGEAPDIMPLSRWMAKYPTS